MNLVYFPLPTKERYTIVVHWTEIHLKVPGAQHLLMNSETTLEAHIGGFADETVQRLLHPPINQRIKDVQP